jgi:anti-sigma B factor antagonist
VVAVAGEVDLATAPELPARLRDAVASPASAVVADLADVEFLDSSGVGALLIADQTARQHGTGLIVRGAKPAVRRVFDILGLTDQLTIESDETPGRGRQCDDADNATHRLPDES